MQIFANGNRRFHSFMELYMIRSKNQGVIFCEKFSCSQSFRLKENDIPKAEMGLCGHWTPNRVSVLFAFFPSHIATDMLWLSFKQLQSLNRSNNSNSFSSDSISSLYLWYCTGYLCFNSHLSGAYFMVFSEVILSRLLTQGQLIFKAITCCSLLLTIHRRQSHRQNPPRQAAEAGWARVSWITMVSQRCQWSTIDIVFSVCQLQENCREQQILLLSAFIDLTKAFDLVSKIYFRSPTVLSPTKSFHRYEGDCPVRRLCEIGLRLAYNSLRYILLPDAKVCLWTCLGGHSPPYSLRWPTFQPCPAEGQDEDPRGYHQGLTRWVLSRWCSRCGSFSTTSQALLDRFSLASKEFGLTTSLKKTNIHARHLLPPSSLTIQSWKLSTNSTLGSSVTDNLSLDAAELDIRLRKAVKPLAVSLLEYETTRRWPLKPKWPSITPVWSALFCMNASPGLPTRSKRKGSTYSTWEAFVRFLVSPGKIMS